MSVTELPPHEREFERTPPHDLTAEQCVLGGMLLSQDAIADVVEALRTQDFYRPAHQLIYNAILDLYGRGEPADAVTVSNTLTKSGEIARVGGAPYLHTLISSVPTAANAGYYAKIVQERAVLRKLVEVGTRITQRGYAADGADADAILDWAEAEVLSIAEKRTGEDYVQLSEIMPGALDEIEAIGSRGGQMVGVPTGFQDLDALTNGLHPGQMIIVAARPAMGKALALDTPLPTPDGWTTMGEVKVGDQLLAADGSPTRVVAATEVMTDRLCYEITFDDGSVVTADAEHQWLTDTHASRRSARAAAAASGSGRRRRVFASVKTTREIAGTLRHPAAGGRLNHSVMNARQLDLPDRDLVLPPYALGAWLGGGHAAAARITTADPEILVGIEAAGVQTVPVMGLTYALQLHCPEGIRGHGTVQAILRKLGVLDVRHIPAAYLRASASQRRALLAGLLDAGGTVTRGGRVEFAVPGRRLAEDFRELVNGLGYRCSMRDKRAGDRSKASPAVHTLTFSTSDEVFVLERKKLAHKESGPGSPARAGSRSITSVRPVPSVPVRCVEIDHPDHLYLATRSMIPTHNSTLALDFARAASIKHGLTSAFFSLEMSRNEITMRLLSAEARIALHAMRSGTMQDEDWTRLARRMSEVAEAPLFIDDSPNMSMMEIRAKCRRLKQRHDLRLVVVDYLQLMSSGKRAESRQVEVSEFSRSLKLLAKELQVPVIALSQLNRGPEQRTDKKPMVSDLRESGSLEQDADVVVLLHREDAYEKESPRAGEADLIVAKHRNGPTATVTVAFQGHYSRFVDMAQ
jgi:replicative DNA helicase